MRRVNVTVPLYLPRWIYYLLRTLKKKINRPPSYHHEVVNLLGDRDIEWSWVAAHMPMGPGEALDFGPGDSHLGLIAARRGFNVLAVDLVAVHWLYTHPNLQFIQGDVLKLPLPRDSFDLIINCSTIEHIGLAGRYGIMVRYPDGDLEAMTYLRWAMKGGGMMLLTIPIGRDAVYVPLHRVYGPERLPRLLDSYIVEREEYWVKNDRNAWLLVDKKSALAREPREQLYGLGCFILRRPEE